MRRVTFGAAALAVACLVPAAANAGPITYVDPVIGVRGLASGASADIRDSSAQPFADPCQLPLTDGYICADYKIQESDVSLADGIFSITLRFLLDGVGVAFESLFVDGFSQFQVGQSVEGDNTAIRLSGDGSVLTCGFQPVIGIESYSYSTPRPCTVGDDIAVFISPTNRPDGTFTVQALAVNDVPNAPVPEPASLLLMSSGIAVLARKTLRRKA